MKAFFTSLLGSLTALIIFFCGGLFLFFIVAIALASAGKEKAPVIENGSYLVFNTSVNITDAPPPFDRAALARLFGGDAETHTMQLRQITNALRAAAKDSRIVGVYLSGHVTSSGYGSGLAALREVRAALEEVKAAKKPVIAFVDFATTRDLYLTSVADDVVLDPFGMIFMPGLASEPMFMAGAFEKYGVGVQVTRAGKYKSYVEPFTRKDMSPENREQLQKLLNDLWGGLVSDICQSRGLKPAELQAVVDAEGLIRAESALKSKLVSRVAYRDQVYDELKSRTGRAGSKEPFKQVSLSDYAESASEQKVGPAKTEQPAPAADKKAHGGKIAVVYAEGAIVDGQGEADEVGGTRFARELRKFRQDDEVKAIVLRVNSPGGSATASEEIQREVRLARKVKPVIVSMGTYAASGGYWISAYGDRIFAEPTTITGSIGVFGIFFDVQKLFNNFGLTFDRVKTGKFADVATISRPKTEEEMALFQHMIDWIYGQFIGKVVEGRKLDRAKVEEIAQGRVWSGAEAVKLGLVDELGGLDAAIACAAERSGLGNRYRLAEYPRKKDFAEAIAEAFGGIKPASSRAPSGVVSQAVDRLQQEAKVLEQFNDRAGVYARMPFELQVK